MSLYVSITCDNCGLVVDKLKREINRQQRAGRSAFYCDLKCSSTKINSSERSREAGRLHYKLYLLPLVHDPDHASKAILGRERWKYVDLTSYLKLRSTNFQFEYPLMTDEGRVRIYDLCLPDYRLLIEFDGEYHERSICFSRDQEKDLLAIERGWKLIRIPVISNTVISPTVMRGIL